jgi:hypothetical protein
MVFLFHGQFVNYFSSSAVQTSYTSIFGQSEALDRVEEGKVRFRAVVSY